MSALLAEDEPPPYELFNPEGAAPILLICDHASRRVPRRLRDLGLDERELSRKYLPPRFHTSSTSSPATGD